MAKPIIRFLVMSALLTAMGPQPWARAATSEKFIRVAIRDNVEELTFSMRGRYQIADSGDILEKGRSSRKFTLAGNPSGIRINDKIYPTRKIRIRADKDIALYRNDKVSRYRGALDIIQRTNQKLLVVNVIELEQYIRGVLYHEVSHRWPMEAMKAQAVAARTYALYQMKKNKGEPYDVTGDIYSQVYGGKTAERFRTNLAVRRTAGEVLVYRKKILPAYFHSSCGGHTENAKNIWGENLPPLAGVACSFCTSLPHHFWKRNYRSKDIQDKLAAAGYQTGTIAEIRILGRNESGRIDNLAFVSRDGRTTKIPGIKFREIIGPNTIKSNNYEVVMKGYYFDLIGKGWGHGVGMCQWGTYAMAEARRNYKDILAFYYPGSAMTDYRAQPPVDLP